MKKEILVKLFIICIGAVVCGLVVGLFFSFFFYAIVDRIMPGRTIEIYLSDTRAKMYLRFWIAFAVGAVTGAAWLYKIVKEYK
jgi:hypothetical protein